MITSPEAGRLDPGLRRLWDLYQAQQYAQLLTEAEQMAKAAGGKPPPALLGLVAMGFLGLEQIHDALRTARMATAQTAQPPRGAWLYMVLAEAESAAAQTARAGGSEHARHLGAAVAAAQVANRMLPDQVAYSTALSRFLRGVGDLDAAAAMAGRAIAVDPTWVDGHLELGQCRLAQGQSEAALAAFRLAQSADPDDARGHLEEGRARLALAPADPAQRAAARAALRRALAIDPGLEAAEDALVASFAGRRIGIRRVLLVVVELSRLNLLGISILAFLYYVAYRLLQMLGWVLPATWPVARVVLQVALVLLLAALAGGRILRWWLRVPRPSI